MDLFKCKETFGKMQRFANTRDKLGVHLPGPFTEHKNSMRYSGVHLRSIRTSWH